MRYIIYEHYVKVKISFCGKLLEWNENNKQEQDFNVSRVNGRHKTS